MTKAELIAALRNIPDEAVIRTSDDLNITGVTLQNNGRGVTNTTVVYLEDDGDAEA